MSADDRFNHIARDLEALEGLILELESDSGNMDLLRQVFVLIGLDQSLQAVGNGDRLLEKFEEGDVRLNEDMIDTLLSMTETVKRFVFQILSQVESNLDPYGVLRNADDPAPMIPEAAIPELPEEEKSAAPDAQDEQPEEAFAQAPILDPAHFKAGSIIRTIKVGTDKLDAMMEAAKELVVTNTIIVQHRALQDDDNKDLYTTVLDHGRAIETVLDRVREMRKITLAVTFTRMERLVRDIARDTDKHARLETHGGEVEVDKTVADELTEPLMHLLRNSVDHGLEPPQDRMGAGKDETGTVAITVSTKEEDVILEVSDDGRGLDKERILEKAYERGLLSRGEVPPDQDIYEFVLMSGFSTAEKTTAVSGRGVGMDVVARKIKGLGGRMSIRSEPGKGCTFTIRLPFDRAAVEGIIDGVVVRAGEHHMIIPSGVVLSVLEPRAQDMGHTIEGTEFLHIRGETHVIIRLDCLAGMEAAEEKGKQLAVLVDIGGRRKSALIVDEILGRQQVVVRSFSGQRRLLAVDFFTGAAFLGDKTAIVLDVDKLYDTMFNKGKYRWCSASFHE